MSEQQLTVIPAEQRAPSIIDLTGAAMKIESLLAQRSLIEKAMAQAMKPDQHYGKIPGCGEKPTLLQPGAQLLANLFRLRPEYEIIESDLPGGHKGFRITCRLFFVGSQPPIPVGEGVGEGSSMESKHRYRNSAAAIEWTEDIVPPTYWDLRNKDRAAADEWARNHYPDETSAGKRVGVKKNDAGEWRFCFFVGGGEDKVENPNPADVFNSVLKVTKKRAFVDAVITATASSDFFTQDLEDIAENVETTRRANAAGATSGAAASGTGKTAGNGQGANTGQSDDLTASLKQAGDVVVRWGKKNGPIKGKALKDLNDDTVDWLSKHYAEKEKDDPEGKKLSKADRKLKAAIGLLIASRKSKAAGNGGDPGNGKAGEWNGENHAMLARNLEWAGVTQDQFMEIARAKKWIPDEAKIFRNMSDPTAKKFVDDWQAVAAAIAEAGGDEIPGLGKTAANEGGHPGDPAERGDK